MSYPAGPLTVLYPDALHAMKRDLSAWYDRALATGGSAAAK